MANEFWLISDKAREEIRDLCLGEPYRCPNRLKMILNLIETGVHETNAVPSDFEDEIVPEIPVEQETLDADDQVEEPEETEGGAF